MYLLDQLEADLSALRAQGAFVADVGYTLLGRPIPAVHKGNFAGVQVLVQACIHAREWVTTPLVMRLMRDYAGDTGVWCVPMVDIDGALLAQLGVVSVPDYNLQKFLLQVNGGSSDFSLWKANARAVDVNVNFNADWGTGTQNVRRPAPGNYIGAFPCSEPETIALVDLTNRVTPEVTLSYHAQGEVIYKGFGCRDPYPAAARRIADATGYELSDSRGSAGGYKDWYVATTNKLGLTLEVGSGGDYPALETQLDKMIAQNADVLNVAAQAARNIG